jgi:uncharacterized protein (DUF885 family)
VKTTWLVGLLAMLNVTSAAMASDFEQLRKQFVDGYPALFPVAATALGDHRFDDRLDEVGSAANQRQRSFLLRMREQAAGIDAGHLSREQQVDLALLRQQLEHDLWSLEELAEWRWNPLVYTNTAGSALYGLLVREFAPLPERLRHAAARMEALPRFYRQVRETLVPAEVPKIHAETAIQQNPGMLSLISELVEPWLKSADAPLAARLTAAIATARKAVDAQQAWLEKTLLPQAAGDFRLGAERFDRKLRFTLFTPLNREQVRERAQAEYQRVRQQMFEVAKQVYTKQFPLTQFPEQPDEAYRQAIIRSALEMAYAKRPARDEIVSVARKLLLQTTEFVRDKDLVTVPDDPVEIVIMPEFQRGVAVAYCDSPGPLDQGQKTFYAVAPLPESWTDSQVDSFLREYNTLSIQDLTIHEAMPGHYLQLAHANRHPSTLRAMLASGPFIEGWAVYAERMMIDSGYLADEPLMRLINLKWYLRVVTNALMDQAIHVDGMNREEAMQLMVEGGFQEEREAAGKWVRAQLTSTQLSTYFVGYQEHADLRREAEQRWKGEFSQKRYHDRVLSFGSPPTQYVRALLLDEPIPVFPADRRE